MAGAAAVGTIVAGVVKGIGAFVKYLVSYIATGDEVPGLAAMVPGGPFIKELQKEQPNQPKPGTNWYVVSSNFHVSLLDDSHRPPEFSKELVRKLKEGFVDQLFHGDNDLVVDVASMSAIGPKSGGYRPRHLRAGRERRHLPQQLLLPAQGDRGPRQLAAARHGRRRRGRRWRRLRDATRRRRLGRVGTGHPRHPAGHVGADVRGAGRRRRPDGRTTRGANPRQRWRRPRHRPHPQLPWLLRRSRQSRPKPRRRPPTWPPRCRTTWSWRPTS